MRRLWILPVLVASVLLNASEDVAALAEEKCGACHIVNEISREKIAAMSAPPVWAVAKKVKLAYPNKQEGIAFVVDYSLHPAQSKMLFPDATLERFGIMPSQKGIVTEEELRAIAEYLLDK
jgi:mono/diheme cytochrome c family protein